MLDFSARRWVRAVQLALFSSFLLSPAWAEHPPLPDQDADVPILFGIAPFMSPLALAKRMAPLRAYLSDTLKQPVIIETSTDAREFARRSLSGRYDILLTNPPFALAAVDSGRYQLLLSQQKNLVGEIVVLSGSPLTSVEQLAGKTIGTPPKIGLLGKIVEPFLSELGLVDEKAMHIRYFHSHHDSISALKVGDIDASFIANFMRPHIENKGIPVHSLASSREYPGMILLANKLSGAGLSVEVKASVLRLGDSDIGRSVLKAIAMPPFRIIGQDELEIVRPLIPVLGRER